MATPISSQTAFLTSHPASNVLPFGSRSSSTPIGGAGRRRAKHRPRSATGAEKAISSALSWLGSLAIEGLVHCAFVHHAGDPHLIQQILDERNLKAETANRQAVPEVRP